jgi:hypothetical protein
LILARERIRAVKAGDAVLVTSDNRTADLIRSLVSDAAGLGRGPADASEAVGSLSRSPRSGLAGVLYVYLTEREAVNNPALCAKLLGQMIGSPSAPPLAWNLYSAAIVLNYPRLSIGDRSEAVERFAVLSQQANVLAAVSGLRGLAAISAFDDSVRSMIPATAMDKVAASYRSLVVSGMLPPDGKLESVLGAAR